MIYEKTKISFTNLLRLQFCFIIVSPNTEDLISEPVSDPQEDPVLVSNLSFE